jgi:tRNA-binding protein
MQFASREVFELSAAVDCDNLASRRSKTLRGGTFRLGVRPKVLLGCRDYDYAKSFSKRNPMETTPPTSPPSPAASPAAAPVAAGNTITIDDFSKLQLRVATVLECVPHPNADKLLVLQVDLGDEKRQICAGLRGHVDPASVVGKQIIIVANLAPRMMRGQVSQGMLLAATDSIANKVVLATTAEPVQPGSGVR